MRIGAILTILLPFVTLLLTVAAPVGELTFFNFSIFNALPELFLGVLVGFVVISAFLGIIALKFQNDVASGNSQRIVHSMILGVIIFIMGSNIGGALVGVGAFLCHISRNAKSGT